MPTATLTLDHIQAALRLPAVDIMAAWEPMFLRPNMRRIEPPPGETPRQAGVLLVLYPVQGVLTTVLIRRAPDPGVHSGQVGLPGGAHEQTDSDLTATAIREACEEVSLCGPVTILGQLTPLYIPPSRFMVTPTVGVVTRRPRLKPNPQEVAELIEWPLVKLLDDSHKQEEEWVLQGQRVVVPFYAIKEHKVWGATALMLSEMEWRLRVIVHPTDDRA